MLQKVGTHFVAFLREDGHQSLVPTSMIERDSMRLNNCQIIGWLQVLLLRSSSAFHWLMHWLPTKCRSNQIRLYSWAQRNAKRHLPKVFCSADHYQFWVYQIFKHFVIVGKCFFKMPWNVLSASSLFSCSDYVFDLCLENWPHTNTNSHSLTLFRPRKHILSEY